MLRIRGLESLIVVGVLLLAAACGETSVSTDEGQDSEPVAAEGAAADLQSMMEANTWQIVDRSGFETSVVDGEVSFQVTESWPNIRLVSLPCGREGLAAIEWNEEGFRVVDLPPDSEIAFGTEDSGCSPPDLSLIHI